MLAPLIFDMLIASLLLLLVGWASDALRASTHDGRDATRTVRPVWRHQPPGRLPSFRLSIGQLHRQAPEPQSCH
jgi:hypothetical protein